MVYRTSSDLQWEWAGSRAAAAVRLSSSELPSAWETPSLCSSSTDTLGIFFKSPLLKQNFSCKQNSRYNPEERQQQQHCSYRSRAGSWSSALPPSGPGALQNYSLILLLKVRNGNSTTYNHNHLPWKRHPHRVDGKQALRILRVHAQTPTALETHRS